MDDKTHARRLTLHPVFVAPAQYFMGANNSIQHAGVQYILDSVLLALEANPDRKFTYGTAAQRGHAACLVVGVVSLFPTTTHCSHALNRACPWYEPAVEQAFFQRWWNEQSPANQASVKALVAAGQLEFVNGGWCMHDEAATHYVDMVDQTTLGHTFIATEFGEAAAPRIGWQVPCALALDGGVLGP